MNYLVTSIYSGALHISPMRVFETEEDAWKYRDSGVFGMETVRVYQLFPDQAPILIKRAK